MVESSEKTWSTGEGNRKPLLYSCLENPMNSMKRQNDRILKDGLPRSVGTQYATGEELRNNSRKNEETDAKWKRQLVVDVTCDGSKVWCYKEQYCVGSWNVGWVHESRQIRSGQTEMARVNVDFFRNQWTKMDWNGQINSDDHYIFYSGQESPRRNGVVLIVNKRVWNVVLGWNLKNDRIFSAHFKANHSIS